MAGQSGVRWPISVDNGRALDLHRCEGLAVARAGGTQEVTSWSALAGSALDAYVAHVLHEGPVADPVADLRSMWCAQGRDIDVAALDGFLDDSDPDAVAERLARLSDLSLAAGTLSVDPAWVPRVEVPVGVTVGGVLALRGRIDVLLGGPGTGRPTVIIEVKSGRGHPDHHAQLRHYVLLCALRHGEMPLAAGIWYPGPGVTGVHIVGAAEAAAERVSVAASKLVELWQGRPAHLHAGPHCSWCPVADGCPMADRTVPQPEDDTEIRSGDLA